MAAKPISLQDHFLNSVRRARTPLTVYLLKGVKLQGAIGWFDSFSLLLRREGQSQLVYKHSISTILPSRPLDLGWSDERAPAAKPALQDAFLAAAARERQEVSIFLVNGVMLQGQMSAHDQFSLLLERAGQPQLVYKHAISTIQPSEPLSLGGEEADGQSGQ